MKASIIQKTWGKFKPPESEDTFPKLLRRNYQRWGEKRVAYRYKDFGIWQEMTWKDVYEGVRWLAGGLASLGFGAGDRVAICGENAPEWFMGQMAAQSLGGLAVGLYTDGTPKELQYIIDHSEAKIIMVDDQEQVDKILSIREEVPRVEKLIYWIAKGMWVYRDPWLLAFDHLMELGKEYERSKPLDIFDKGIDSLCGDSLALILYTSGTTGRPKGSMITYGNLLSTFRGWDSVLPWEEKDEILSFLPPAWIGEQIFTVSPNVIKGTVINFVEKAETVRADLREIGAKVILFGARQWEMICSEIQSKMIDAPWWKRSIYSYFLPIGYKVAQLQSEGHAIPLYWKILRFIAYWSVFRALQDKIGLRKTRMPITGGSALSPDNLKFLRAIGIQIAQGYGTTEQSGLGTIEVEREYYKEGASGEPVPSVEVRISNEGEILLGGTGLTKGYFKDPEATEKNFRSGFFHTGDGGYMDDFGRLYIVDRVKDMQRLENGETFSPTYIEGRLKFSPYIKDCMVVGDGRKYVIVIINMDYENTGRWAERNHIGYTSHVDLSKKKEVGEVMRDIVRSVNTSLPEAQRIFRFVVLHKDFDADEAELTRTRKLRREFMEKRYKDVIESLFGGKEEITIGTNLTYRDGREIAMHIKLYALDVYQGAKPS